MFCSVCRCCSLHSMQRAAETWVLGTLLLFPAFLLGCMGVACFLLSATWSRIAQRPGILLW